MTVGRPSTNPILNAVAKIPPGQALALAYSGGVDSEVLLHALATQATKKSWALRVLHVNHQLHPEADAWASHCREHAKTYRLPCEVLRITLPSSTSTGIEAAARTLRYAALQAHLAPQETLLTAHHLDDQAETLLLQLLRGAGPEGLSAMPEVRALGDDHSLLRPLLSCTREEITAYASLHQLSWIDDHSNTDTRFDRNYLRHEIMPKLQARWPAAHRTLARAATHCAALTTLQTQYIQPALGEILGYHPGSLSLPHLMRHTRVEQAALMRFFFKQHNEPACTTAQLETLLDQCAGAAPDRQPALKLTHHIVKRYQSHLYLVPKDRLAIDPTWSTWWDLTTPLLLPSPLIPLSPSAFQHYKAPLLVRFRQGGERIQLAGKSHTQSLKKLWQADHTPPWERAITPLLFSSDGTLCAAGTQYQSQDKPAVEPLTPPRGTT
jgi:tRNA(Ile)-lysidine synthase